MHHGTLVTFSDGHLKKPPERPYAGKKKNILSDLMNGLDPFRQNLRQ